MEMVVMEGLPNPVIWLMSSAIAALIIFIIVYWSAIRRHNHWKKVGIPYVEAVPFYGSLKSTMNNPVHKVEMDRYLAKGRIYGFYEASRPVLTVADPDILKDIFVRDFNYFTCRRSLSGGDSLAENMVSNLRGEDWKRVRTLITPTFTTGKIKRMTNIFLECVKTLGTHLENGAKEGKPVDMKRLFGAFTMDVIASSAFGTRIDSHQDPENPFVQTARSVFYSNMSWRLKMFHVCPQIMKMLRISVFAPGPVNFFKDAALKIVEERKQSGQRRNDFLQLLMDAEENLRKEGINRENDSATEMGHDENNDQIFRPGNTPKSLTTDELVAQCIIFFMAGYDTTASTLACTVYEMALNPDIQNTLIAEIDDSLREQGPLRYETIYEMKYLDRVVLETLRKYPPGTKAERVADADYRIRNHNITVEKGMIVSIPIYAIHHDSEHYPDPEKYDPERFTPEGKATRHPYTYLPFGAGPRNCVAMRFALMEVKVGLAYLFSRFRFHQCPETPIPLEYFNGQDLLTPKEVTVKIEQRSDAVVV